MCVYVYVLNYASWLWFTAERAFIWNIYLLSLTNNISTKYYCVIVYFFFFCRIYRWDYLFVWRCDNEWWKLYTGSFKGMFAMFSEEMVIYGILVSIFWSSSGFINRLYLATIAIISKQKVDHVATLCQLFSWHSGLSYCGWKQIEIIVNITSWKKETPITEYNEETDTFASTL